MIRNRNRRVAVGFRAGGFRTVSRAVYPWFVRWVVVAGLLVIGGSAWCTVATGDEPPLKLNYPFFAFDNGTGRGKTPAAEQAAMLAELGYAGIGYTGAQRIPEMLQALDQHGLKMFSIYVAAHVGAGGPSYDQHLEEACRALRGRKTIIWLTVQGKIEDDDRQAVTVVRQVADLADKYGLRVALYPHYGCYVGTVRDSLRVVKKVQRKNVGVSFNLCHWLRGEQSQTLESLLPDALPYLMLVSINGADSQGGWPELIQTLDRGSYDVLGVLAQLKRLGYQGPVGLQCYNVKGDRRRNLQRSIKAWNSFVERMRER